MTLVSVIIPTYNSASFLPKAIDSVLKQTVSDLELIVADDGSTDDTAAVIAAIGDSRVKHLALEHRGRSPARNSGIQHAVGRYVAFLDADDWWTKDKLARQLALFAQNERLGLVFCWLRQIGPDGKLLRSVRGIDGVGDGQGDWLFERLLFGNIGGPGSTVLISRQCLDQVGGFRPDLAYAEDWDFCLRAAHLFPLGYVPDELAFYRAHQLYLPAKNGRLDSTQASLTVVRNALALAGIASDTRLYRQAMANALWNCCLQSVGVDDFTAAAGFLSEAFLLDPERLDVRGRSQLAQSIGYFANSLYDTLTPLDEAVSYVHKLFEHLIDGCPQLAAGYRPALAWTCAIQAFEGEQFGVPSRTRHAFWRAMLHDPAWFRHIGLWSVGIHACVQEAVQKSGNATGHRQTAYEQ